MVSMLVVCWSLEAPRFTMACKGAGLPSRYHLEILSVTNGVWCQFEGSKLEGFLLFFSGKLSKLLTWLLGQGIHRRYYMSILVSSLPLRRRCFPVPRVVVGVVSRPLNCNIADGHHHQCPVPWFDTQIVRYLDCTMRLWFANRRFLFRVDNQLYKQKNSVQLVNIPSPLQAELKKSNFRQSFIQLDS